MKNICSSFLMGVLLFLGTHLLAQESEVSYFDNDFISSFNKPTGYSLEDCIKLSDVVLEGTVTSSKVIRGNFDRDSTYTILYINVIKTFKGETKNRIALVYENGLIKDSITQEFSGRPSLIFKPGYTGVFFAKNTSNFSVISEQKFSFLQLGLEKHHVYIDYGNITEMEEWIKVVNQDIEKELKQIFYSKIEQYTGKKFKKHQKLFSVKPKKAFRSEKISK